MILFIIARFVMVQFDPEPSIWLTFVPLAVGMILSPKPHIEETEQGRVYGLKSIFLEKIYYLNN